MGFQNHLKNERGVALAIGLMFLAIVALLGTTAVVLTTTDMQVGANYKTSVQAFSDADAGVNYGIGMIEAGLKASPPTFTMPTVIGDPTDPNDANSVRLAPLAAFSAPSGFGFSYRDPGLTMLATNLYTFTTDGTGPNNSSATITVTLEGGGVDPAFNVGILSEGNIEITGKPLIDGGIHSNGNVIQNSHGGTVIGSISAVGSASGGSCGDDCTLTPGADRIDVPLITEDEFSAWRTKAQTPPNIYCPGPSCTYSDPGAGNIYFADGDIDFANNLSTSAESDVTIIAYGDIIARGSSIKKADGNIGLALIAGGNIDFRGGGGAELNATFWCNGDYQHNGMGTVVGSIVAGGSITRHGRFDFRQDSNIDNENLPPGNECSVITWNDLNS